MLLKNILRKCHGQKMLFYRFLGPLEGLKSRPFHHCLFSSDLARPKKKKHSSVLRPIVLDPLRTSHSQPVCFEMLCSFAE